MRRLPRPLFRSGLAAAAVAVLAALPVVTPAPQGASAATPLAPQPPQPGYWLVGGDGSVYSYGSAGALGSLRGIRLARPIVGMAPTVSGAGYWLVGSDGGIFSFGDAAFHGSTGDVKLNQPIVGMAATPTGNGYWFVAADGGIFSFGDAAFYGSTGNVKLNKPIVGMAATPSGKGYWFVASDGGIFSFGDAAFYGSTGASGGKTIAGMAATPSGHGYWFVTTDGGIFNFGDAPALGSVTGTPLPARIVVMAGAQPTGITTSSTDESTTTVTGPTSTGPATTTTTAGPPPTGDPFQIALVGDSGYNAAQYPIFDRVVEHMNGFPLSFVVHDGDFKDPAPACSDDRLREVKEAFNRSKAPFVYTPGDNEWMDCNKMAKVDNRKDPVERLGKLRELFFAQDESLGVHRMPLTTQRQQGYPENARWTKEGVVFATINAPGPSDNQDYCGQLDPQAPCDPSQVAVESNPRRQANFSWLQQTFEQARATNAPAVMIIWQADPWAPTFGKTWKYLVDELKAQSLAFGKPVVLVHGDSHDVGPDGSFRLDKGGRPAGAGGPIVQDSLDDVPNFTRVETYAGGSFTAGAPVNPEKWIRVTVDPKSAGVFSFTTETAP